MRDVPGPKYEVERLEEETNLKVFVIFMISHN